MTVEALNRLSAGEASHQLSRCCGSSRWVSGMLALRPYRAAEDVLRAADTIWTALAPSDWNEAFRHHPRIGDLKHGEEKFSATARLAAGEQRGIRDASDAVLQRLREANEEYERKFGFIYIVCATGKKGDEMLENLKSRLANDAPKEVRVAAEEQRKITTIRLKHLLEIR
ncbi:MAG TPA: 2-oxo-4-hydroxy-4-carboxy-5-ureidoimidazoline decarboxylase [Bacteroidota bacterium]|nr:2-oxo-4-hydroxy-4-carboxy-5-ureidoimidazoline decarboxylase [Bacteroidota bacterium]